MCENSQVPDNWKEFELRLASGDDIESLLGLKDIQESQDDEEPPKNQLNVNIGDQDFPLKFILPSFDEVLSVGKSSDDETFEPLVPYPPITKTQMKTLVLEQDEKNNEDEKEIIKEEVELESDPMEL